MGRRYIDSDIFRSPFYKGLPMEYKLLWQLLLCECDCAGIWPVELDIAQLRIGKGVTLTERDALAYFNGDGHTRILPFDRGRKWFICDYICFQLGKLLVTIEDGKPKGNRWHVGVYQRLQEYGLEKYINLEDGKFLQPAETQPFQQNLSPLDAPTQGLLRPSDGCKEYIVNNKELIVKSQESENAEENFAEYEMIDAELPNIDVNCENTLFPAFLFANPHKLSSANFEAFRERFNAVFAGTSIPKLTRTLNEGRKSALRARLAEVKHDVSVIGRLFYIVLHSPFLLGWAATDRKWKCTYDFMFSPSGFNKILDLNYEFDPNIDPHDETTYRANSVASTAKQSANEAAIQSLQMGNGQCSQEVLTEVPAFF